MQIKSTLVFIRILWASKRNDIAIFTNLNSFFHKFQTNMKQQYFPMNFLNSEITWNYIKKLVLFEN